MLPEQQPHLHDVITSAMLAAGCQPTQPTSTPTGSVSPSTCSHFQAYQCEAAVHLYVVRVLLAWPCHLGAIALQDETRAQFCEQLLGSSWCATSRQPGHPVVASSPEFQHLTGHTAAELLASSGDKLLHGPKTDPQVCTVSSRLLCASPTISA